MSQQVILYNKQNQIVFAGLQAALGQPLTDLNYGQLLLGAGGLVAGSILTIKQTAANTIVYTATAAATALQVISDFINAQAAYNTSNSKSTFASGGGFVATYGTFTVTGTGFTAFLFSNNTQNAGATWLGIRDLTGGTMPSVVGSVAVLSGTAGTLVLTSWTTGTVNGVSAIAAGDIKASPKLDVGSFNYYGGATERNQYNYLKDIVVNCELSTPLQVIGVTGSTLNSVNVATTLAPAGYGVGSGIFGLMEACGGYLTATTSAVGTLYPNGLLQVDNSILSSAYAGLDLHDESLMTPTLDKVWKAIDLQGTFSLTANTGELPMLKFMLEGNIDTNIAYNAPFVTPNWSAQLVNIAPPPLPTNVISQQLVPLVDPAGYTAYAYSAAVTITMLSETIDANNTSGTNSSNIALLTIAAGHGIPLGNIVSVLGSADTSNPTVWNSYFIGQAISATVIKISVNTANPSMPLAGTYSIGIGKTTALPVNTNTFDCDNFFGYKLDRYLTGSLKGFIRTPDPTDVKMKVVQDQTGTTNFDPDAPGNYMAFFGVMQKWGTTTGAIVTIIMDKLQLADVAPDEIGQIKARALTFKNTGKSYLIIN